MNKYTLALAFFTCFTTNTANARLIDDFTDGVMAVEADGFGIYGGSSVIFGGGRSVSISTLVGDGAEIYVINVDGGLYIHDADALSSATSSITWSNTSGVDLVETINNVFSLDILGIDQGMVDLTLSITDSHSVMGSFTLFNAGAGIETIAFTEFSGIDFHEITDISLQIAGGIGSDLAIGSLKTEVSAVPIPPSLILFSSSLALLSMGRRKV